MPTGVMTAAVDAGRRIGKTARVIAAASMDLSDSGDQRVRRIMLTLLAMGLLLRIAVFFATGPFNRDDHFGVIRFLAEHGTLPVSNALQQSYHPPLYYLLALPFHLVAPADATWPIHALSLGLSCVNLLLIWRLFDDPTIRDLVPSPGIRAVAFGLIATHAPFVRWSSFVSNDPLTYLIGTLLFRSTLRMIRSPSAGQVAATAIWAALGMLTKGTFLLAGVGLLPIVFVAVRRAGGATWRLTAIFAAIALGLGSYKYIENVVRLGRPFVHNLERPEMRDRPDRTIWRGWATVYDVDVTKVIRHPVVRPRHPTSYPLTLYATFWYAHFADDDLRGHVSGYDIVGRATYAIAVVPTLLVIAGIGIALARLRCALRSPASLALAAAVVLVVSNVAVVVAAGVRFDRWDCFQSRLFMQTMLPLGLLFATGLGALSDWRNAQRFAIAACWALVALAVLYYLVEFALLGRLLPVDESLLLE